MTTRETGYLHGFSIEEQERLVRQAEFLEQSVYRNVFIPSGASLLEVGCGVGAQTEILLRRFPKIRISAVDLSEEQIEAARERLGPLIQSGRVEFHSTDARKLPFAAGSFDAAFLCWFLEHVSEPVPILREVRRMLKPGGSVFLNEVLNATFFVHPYSPHTLRYWFEFNDQQWNLGGDPFVGAKLGNHLLQAGFGEIETIPVVHHYDSRTSQERARFIEEWIRLLLSGAPSLLQAGKTDLETVEGMKRELEKLKDDHNAVFYYSWMQARARAL